LVTAALSAISLKICCVFGHTPAIQPLPGGLINTNNTTECGNVSMGLRSHDPASKPDYSLFK